MNPIAVGHSPVCLPSDLIRGTGESSRIAKLLDHPVKPDDDRKCMAVSYILHLESGIEERGVTA
jgi:hypothetical protein